MKRMQLIIAVLGLFLFVQTAEYGLGGHLVIGQTAHLKYGGFDGLGSLS